MTSRATPASLLALFGDLTARFVNLPVDDVDAAIESTQERICKAMDLDRATLWQFSSAENSLTMTHSWQSDPGRIPPGLVARSIFPWIHERILKGELMRIPDVDHLPPEAATDREALKRYGTRSNLSYPLSMGGKIFGALTFAATREVRAWTDEDVTYMHMLAQVFANVLDRKRQELELRHTLGELRRLKDLLQAESDYLKREVRLSYHHADIVGESRSIKHLLKQIEQVSPTETTVLIMGETGSGKELVARAIHALSPRKDKILVKVDCASLPSGLIESELFGRERGAYTGAMTRQLGRFQVADKSTLFLDEIGELPLELQGKLLRVLDEGEFEPLGSSKTVKVNVRVIAATNRDLPTMVKERKFREDLLYRLRVFPIEVPPLRERAEDIPLLVWNYVRRFSAEMGKSIRTVPSETMDALQAYSWPGNVRELKNLIEQAFIVTTGDTLRLRPPSTQFGGPAQLPSTLEHAERGYITGVLREVGWRIKGPGGAAERLGLKPSTLYAKMKKLGIPVRRDRVGMST